MKKILFIGIFGLLIAFVGCKDEKQSVSIIVTPQEVYDAVYSKDANAQLVDVRTLEEFGASHLKNAQNICVTNDDFEEKVKSLNKNKPVYVYCQKGGRSAKAAKILSDMGFTEVYDLQGGIENWEEKGLDTEM